MGKVDLHGRAKYINIEPHEAKPKGYDLVSLKYDGIWCRALGIRDKIKFFSRDNLLKDEIVVPDSQFDFELIGEYMFGSAWAKKYGIEGNFYAFDMYRLEDRDLTTLPYMQRLDLMSAAVDTLGRQFKKVVFGNISQVDDFRKRFVEPGGEYDGAFEGLVFAMSHRKELQFARWKKDIIDEATIVGFDEGKGRLSGTLGALRAITNNRVELIVGGGFDDNLRHDIWDNKQIFIGAVIEVYGKGRFASGKLRHPNFLRFHPEKNKPTIWEIIRTLH